METSPRVFDSEIKIDENNKWIFKGNEITLLEVLNYFKINLFEDEKGIFILNSYNGLSEKGYVECIGFPLILINYEKVDKEIYFYSDAQEKLSLSEISFFQDKQEKLFCMKNENKFIKHSISRGCLGFISNFIEEENGYYFLKFEEKIYPIQKYTEEFTVKVRV